MRPASFAALVASFATQIGKSCYSDRQVLQSHSRQLTCCYGHRESAIIPKRHSYKGDSYFLGQMFFFLFLLLLLSSMFDGAASRSLRGVLPPRGVTSKIGRSASRVS